MENEHSHIWVDDRCWCGASRGPIQELPGDNYENSPLYTKDLEDILRRVVATYDKLQKQDAAHFNHELIAEAKALLKKGGDDAL